MKMGHVVRWGVLFVLAILIPAPAQSGEMIRFQFGSQILLIPEKPDWKWEHRCEPRREGSVNCISAQVGEASTNRFQIRLTADAMRGDDQKKDFKKLCENFAQSMKSDKKPEMDQIMGGEPFCHFRAFQTEIVYLKKGRYLLTWVIATEELKAPVPEVLRLIKGVRFENK